jgi:hypothetical protein
MATDPVRRKEWETIFYEGKIPIASPIPSTGLLVGEEWLYYLIDFDRVSFAEKEALIFHIAERFELAPAEIRKDIEAQGAPVKAEGIIISICQKHGLAMMPDVEFEEPSDEAEYPDDNDELEEG